MEIIDWRGKYDRSWKGILVPKAFVHPAKISFSLAEAIYTFALEQGMLHAGDKVVDPFAGICGTAFHALQNGMEWYGVELEQKFVALGQANLDAWNKRYAKTMPHWGSAHLMQGDSRKLGAVLQASGFGACVSSPPYAESLQGKANGIDFSKLKDGGKKRTASRDTLGAEYGISEGQLGAMQEGNLDAAISSPPYAGSDVKQTHMASNKRADPNDPNYRPSWKQKFEQEGYGESTREYGTTDGQLGAMQEGSLDGAISSPPYIGIEIASGNAKQADIGDRKERRVSQNWGGYNRLNQDYLGSMKEGSLDGAVSSPPYAAARIGNISGGEQVGHGANYGNGDGQLGAMSDEGFDATISSPPYAETKKGSGAETARLRAKAGKYKGQRPDVWLSEGNVAGSTFGDGYSENPENLGNLKDDGFTLVVSSPPFEDNGTKTGGTQGAGSYTDTDLSQGMNRLKDNYSNMASLGVGETFWSAAKQIVEQTYALLKPNAYAFWIVKAFARNRRVVDFPEQWRLLCESVGFETVYMLKAWQVTDNGQQLAMDGKHKKLRKKKVSFFRRLYEEKYPENAIDFEVVWVMRKVSKET